MPTYLPSKKYYPHSITVMWMCNLLKGTTVIFKFIPILSLP